MATQPTTPTPVPVPAGVKLPIFMDNHSTTPVDPRVLEAMIPYFTTHFGNSASRNHVFGWTAEAAVEAARGQVAALLGGDGKEIVWTSGATEANNLAIKGAVSFYKKQGNHIITVATEHKSVLDTCKRLEREGHEVTYLTPQKDGLVTPEMVAAAMTDKTVLVSVMLANNEIGVVQDIDALGAAVKAKNSKCLFHTDAVQGAGKVPFSVAEPTNLDSLLREQLAAKDPRTASLVRTINSKVKDASLAKGGVTVDDALILDVISEHRKAMEKARAALASAGDSTPDRRAEIEFEIAWCSKLLPKIDLVSVTAHKMYGPKGIGALWVRRKPRVRIDPLIDGGGHERGMRSGTLPVPMIVGFGKAAEIAKDEMKAEAIRLRALRDRLYRGITSKLTETYVNGSMEHRLPGNMNISFAFVEGESLLMALKDVAVSSGSACTSASLEPSYVLKALGVGDELAHTSIRFGLGRFNTEAEVDYVIDLVVRSVERLRTLSPLWEMHQDGIDINSIQWTPH